MSIKQPVGCSYDPPRDNVTAVVDQQEVVRRDDFVQKENGALLLRDWARK